MALESKLKNLREKKGLNQKQLAEASGVTQATISRIESGRVRQIRSDSLRRLATALGVTVDFLVDRTERQTPSDILESDQEASYVFRGFDKLSVEGKKKVMSFIEFLEQQEQSTEKGSS